MFFYLFATALTVATFAYAAVRGGRQGLWFGWLAAMLAMPTWIVFQLGSLAIDLRAVGGTLGLFVLLVFGDGETGPKRPLKLHPLALLADLMAIVLFATQVYTQKKIGRFGPLTAPDIARRWLLPYVIGRFYYGSVGDIRKSLPLTARMMMGLCVFAVFEGVTKFHPINKALGKTYGILEAGEGYRWGLKRAQGPLDHPIFFGMMLVLLFPLVYEAYRVAKAGKGPKWWTRLLAAIGAAVFVTVSRGAQISMILTGIMTLFFQKPKWRVAVLVFSVVGGGAGYVGKAVLTSMLSKLAEEKDDDIRLIMINGEEYEYTGTNHRVLLFTAYDEALRTTGYFGFGYELQGIELEEPVALRFSSIDDHYILFLLQYGYVALTAFLILAVVSIVNMGFLAWDVKGPKAAMAAALFGSLASVTVNLLSVWFSPDFGSVYLFCTGLAANLRCLPDPISIEPGGATAPSARVLAASESSRLRPRLVAAHAPVRSSVSYKKPSP